MPNYKAGGRYRPGGRNKQQQNRAFDSSGGSGKQQQNPSRNGEPGPTKMGKTSLSTNKAAPDEIAANTLRIIPLGGQGESGRNCFVLETDRELVLLDCGLGFAPHGSKGGVDLLLPNLEYVARKKNKLAGMFLSNPHEEYAGHFLPAARELGISKVYGPGLLAALNPVSELDFQALCSGEPVQVGEELRITPYAVNFSCVDSYAFLIEYQRRRIFYTGAFKIDHTPPIRKGRADLGQICRQVTEHGVDLLIGNSANVEVPGYTYSEASVGGKLEDISLQSSGRLIAIVGCSSAHRIHLLLAAAKASGRKVYAVGEDTRSWLRAYQERGFLDVPEELLTEDPTEPNAMLLVGALAGDVLDPFIELAYRRHPSVQLVEGDTIVITAKPPVGTTRLLANAVDQLYVLGVQVIGGRDAGVHVEGHAAQEELKFLYNLTRPRNFLPAHGEVRQLILHAELQGKCGLQPNNIIIIDNGHAVDFSASKGTMGVSGQVPARPIYFSQRFSGNLNVESVEERYTLGEDGTLVTVIGLNKDNSKIISGPIVRGLGSALIESRDWPEVERNICQDIVKVVAKALEAGQSDNGQLRRLVHDVLNKRIREKFGMTNPIHSIVIQRQK